MMDVIKSCSDMVPVAQWQSASLWMRRLRVRNRPGTLIKILIFLPGLPGLYVCDCKGAYMDPNDLPNRKLRGATNAGGCMGVSLIAVGGGIFVIAESDSIGITVLGLLLIAAGIGLFLFGFRAAKFFNK